MRKLTSEEKSIVKKLFDWKKTSKLEKLCTTSLLQDNLDCFAIRWKLTPTKTVSIYIEETDRENTDILNNQYFKICDFLYFMDELLENHYIKLQTISLFEDKEKPLQQALYDRTKYEFGFPEGMNKGKLECFFEKSDKEKRLYAVKHIKQEAYTDCVNLLEKYYDKIIYPLPLLDDLVKHKYTSIEERKFNEQMCWTRLSVFIASIAVILTTIFERVDSGVFFDKNQLKKVNQIVINYKTKISDTIQIESPIHCKHSNNGQKGKNPGRFMDAKQDDTPFKGVTKEK